MAGAWRQDPELGGGGALIDMATHLYDLLEYFAGPVRRVVAMPATLVQDYKSDDASTTLLEFKSGAQGTVDCFYCIPDEASRTRLEIYGSQGAILTEGTIGQSDGRQDGRPTSPRRRPATTPRRTRTWSASSNRCRSADQSLHGRMRVLRRLHPPEAARLALNDGRHGVHIMEVTDKAYASYRCGRVGEVGG